MALVQYSDSSEEDSLNNSPPRPTKKRRQDSPPTNRQAESSLPPLPRAFHDLYATSTRVSVRDDPSLHGGRKRVIPHVEGNWPTHIYLEWYPSKEELSTLEDLISELEHIFSKREVKVHSLLRSDLGVQLPLHISLSRPVVLRTEQRHSFTELLQSSLQSSHIPIFDVSTEGLHCVSNYEKTRWFFVLRVKRPKSDSLNRLLKVSNRSLARFDQPPLYESLSSERSKDKSISRNGTDYSACFHISIAWSLTEPSTEDIERIAKLDLRDISSLRIGFDCVKAKIGNNITSIPLSTGAVD
ncbi:U6 snRNA phosphodiesterase Usb1 [Aspergillus ambiguus]|uniref:HVSL domain-containing protein n=1 Tax=Aspergillus ambiguus TaxID=176160 RepID=UPI003CCDD21F